jgi:flavin-binding protein dodecin
MPDQTYTIVDVIAVSEDNIHQTIRNALTKAGQPLRNIDWFEVKNTHNGLGGGDFGCGREAFAECWRRLARRPSLTSGFCRFPIRRARVNVACNPRPFL